MAINALSQESTDENLHREREQAYMQGYEDASKRFRQEPCTDAISRQALLKDLYQYKISCAGRIQAAILEVEELVEKMPSVTPKSETVTEFVDRCRECGKMRKGHWIYTGDYITDGMLKCSECGFEHDVSERFLYCPNCGADMGGDTDADSD